MIRTKRTLAIAVALTAFLAAGVQISPVQAAGKKGNAKVTAKAAVKEAKTATKEANAAAKVTKEATDIKVNKAKTVSAEAAAVNTLISTLPDTNKITLQDKAAVTAAYNAFKLLTKDQKVGLDKNYQGKITAAMNQIKRLEKAAARTLKLVNSGSENFDALAAIGVTGAVETNKTAYDTALASAKAAKGSDLTLEEIQTVIDNVNQQAADIAAATPVSSLISALDSTKDTYLADLAAARAAYDKLSDAQKVLVTNYSVLTTGEQALVPATSTDPATTGTADTTVTTDPTTGTGTTDTTTGTTSQTTDATTTDATTN